MTTDYIPTHARPYSIVRELNRPQPAPRHRSERIIERLGAEAPEVRRLLSGQVSARAEARALGFTR